MKELNILIGQNLKSVRKSQNLSLDEAAALTGVSKPMLGQIERGKSNPTVTTLWKIAAGFKVPFSELMECDEKMKIFTMFSYNDNFEILYVDLEPGCIHISPKHPNEVEEYIFVMEGILRVKIGKKSMILKKGEALKFRANVEHEYANLENVKCRFQNINVYYKN